MLNHCAGCKHSLYQTWATAWLAYKDTIPIFSAVISINALLGYTDLHEMAEKLLFFLFHWTHTCICTNSLTSSGRYLTHSHTRLTKWVGSGVCFIRAIVKHTHAHTHTHTRWPVLCCPLVVFWLTATLGPAFRATLLRGNYPRRGHRLQIWWVRPWWCPQMTGRCWCPRRPPACREHLGSQKPWSWKEKTDFWS